MKQHITEGIPSAGPPLVARPFLLFRVLSCSLGLLLTVGLNAESKPMRWVTDETGRKVEVPLHPQRIISIAPSVTEDLYALGLDSKIVGRSDYCDYPPQARLKPSVGGVINPSIETIVSLRPDLVLGSPEINKIEVAQQLARFNIPLYGVHTRTLDDVLHSLRDVSDLTDSREKAEALIRRLEKRRLAVLQRVGKLPRPRVLFLIWYNPVSVPGHGSYLTNLIAQAGGQSISADLKPDWAQMSLEEIVRRDPEYVLIPSSNESSPPIEKLTHWPGWSATSAARNHRIISVDDSSTRPGPRLFDALEEFAEIFHPRTNGE